MSQEDTATATAALGFVRNLATVLAVMIGGMVFQNGMVPQIPELRKTFLSNELISKLSGVLL